MSSSHPTGSSNPQPNAHPAELLADTHTLVEMPDTSSLSQQPSEIISSSATELPASIPSATTSLPAVSSSTAQAQPPASQNDAIQSEKEVLASTVPEVRTAPMPQNGPSVGYGLDFGLSNYNLGSVGFAMGGQNSTGPSHGAASAGMGFGSNTGLGFGDSRFALAGEGSSLGPSHGAASADIGESKGKGQFMSAGDLGFGATYDSNSGIGFGADYGNTSSNLSMGFAASNVTSSSSGLGYGSNTGLDYGPNTGLGYGANTGLGLGSNTGLNYQPFTTPLSNTTIPAPAQLTSLPSTSSGHHDLPIHPSDPIPDAAYPLNDFALAGESSLSRGPSHMTSLHRNLSSSEDQITPVSAVENISHSAAIRKIDHLAMPGSGLPLNATPQSASAGGSSAGPSNLAVYAEPPPPYEPSDSHSRPNTSATAVSRSGSVNSTAPLQPSGSSSSRPADPSTTLPLVHQAHPPNDQLVRQRQNQQSAYGGRTGDRPWSAAYWINPKGKKGWKKRKRYWVCAAVVLFVVGLSTGLAVSMSNRGGPKGPDGGKSSNGGNLGQGNSGSPSNP